MLVVGIGVSFVADGLYRYEWWAPLALLLFAVFVALVAYETPSFTAPGLLVACLFVFLTAWCALSVTWAESVDRAWTEVDRLALYTTLFLIGLVVVRTPRMAKAILFGLGVAIVLSGLYVVAAILLSGGESLFVAFRLHEPLGYANGEAGLLLMGIFCLVAAAEEARAAWIRAAACAGAVLLANLVVLTQTRAALPAAVIVAALVLLLPGRVRRGWLLLAVAAAVAAALPWTLDVYREKGIAGRTAPAEDVLRAAAVATLVSSIAGGILVMAITGLGRTPALRGRRRLGGAALIGVVLAAVVVAFAAVGSPRDELTRQWEAFRSLDPTPYESAEPRFTSAGGFRYDLWRIAWRQFEREPLTGVGAGNYVETYYRERQSLNNVRQPHSLELQFLAELGLPGGIALLALVGTVLVAALRPPRASAVRGELAIRVAALGVFAAWLVHTSVDWLYNIPGVTGMALLAAGILLGRARAPERKPPPSRLVVVAALVVMTIVAASVARHYGAALYRDRAEHGVSRGDPSRALENARRSLSLNRHDVMTYIAVSAAYAQRNQYRLARGSLLAAAREEPFNFVPWALLGDLATRRGDLAQARRDYARAARLNPKAGPDVTPEQMDAP